MTPQRMPGSEICGNDVKGRVTACRKRLRANRVAQRAQVNHDSEELFLETTTIHLSYPSPFADAEGPESAPLLLPGEQEVGIT